MGRDVARANLATAEITEENNLVFEGALFSRGAVAEVGADLNPKLPGGEGRTKDTEGLTLRVKAEGHVYGCVVRTSKQGEGGWGLGFWISQGGGTCVWLCGENK